MRRPESGTECPTSWWLGFLADEKWQAREYLKSRGLRARDAMTSNVIGVTEDASVEEIATLLERHRIKRVPRERVAHLWGAVFSEAELRTACLAAERTPSVIRVEDHLRIVPPNIRTGMWAS